MFHMCVYFIYWCLYACFDSASGIKDGKGVTKDEYVIGRYITYVPKKVS